MKVIVTWEQSIGWFDVFPKKVLKEHYKCFAELMISFYVDVFRRL